jgi:hypothetical protein
MGIAYSSFAQDTLTFDLKSNKFNPPINERLFLKEGRVVYIKYINANPTAINSNIVVSGSNIIDTAAFNIFQKIITAGVSANKAGEKNMSKISDSLTGTKNLIENNPKPKIKSLVKKLNKAKKDSAQYIRVLFLLQDKQSEIDFINSNVSDIASVQSKINKIIIVDTVINNILTNASIHDKNDFIKFVKESSLLNDPATIKADFDNYIQSIMSDIDRIQTAYGRLQEINNELKTIDTTYAFDTYLSTLNEEITKLQTTYLGSNLVAMQKNVQSILMKYATGTNQDYTVYGSNVFQVKNDVETITDTLRLHDKSIYKVIGPIDIHSYGGARVNFSLGFAATFGNLNATSYYLLRDDSSKITGIGSSRKNSIGNFSPVAMVHYTFKTKGFIYPALSIGFNPDFSSFTSSRLLLGGSITFNESNSVLRRIILSGGLGMGLTDCIKPKYDGITDFSELNNISDNDLTEKAFRFGSFFSASFILGK